MREDIGDILKMITLERLANRIGGFVFGNLESILNTRKSMLAMVFLHVPFLKVIDEPTFILVLLHRGISTTMFTKPGSSEVNRGISCHGETRSSSAVM